ncbi:antigen-presenting glycoprotein CD1d-like [Hyperolius riggenbachi]|uniref:antigen-presenting glycoprotein CD1d-like n=1 Tax=Hyperolius riggenbachi TaxID=752182 RepID=UPI0035A2D828
MAADRAEREEDGSLEIVLSGNILGYFTESKQTRDLIVNLQMSCMESVSREVCAQRFTGCYELVFEQTTEFTYDLEMYPWGTAQFGGIVILSFHNASEGIVFTQSWSKGNLSDFTWNVLDMLLINYFNEFHEHVIGKLQYFGVKVYEVSDTNEAVEDDYDDDDDTAMDVMWDRNRHDDKGDSSEGESERSSPLIVQALAGCSSDPGTQESKFFNLAVNGEDFVHLDVSQLIWKASPSLYAPWINIILNADTVTTKTVQTFLTETCKKLAENLLLSGKAALERRIQPEVFFAHRHRNSEDELICMVTGFYPEPINVSLWKNSKVEIEEALSSVTLPNGDGTFQTEVVLNMVQNKDTELFCKVEHSSLKEPLMVRFETSHSISAGGIVGVVVAICSLVCGIAWFVIRYRQSRCNRAAEPKTIIFCRCPVVNLEENLDSDNI